MCSRNSMKFPDEILLKIFQHLSTHDILKSVAFVCYDFYRLSKDPTLITEIHVKFGDWDETDPRIKNACNVISRSRFLKKLIIEDAIKDTSEYDTEHYKKNFGGVFLSTAVKSCPELCDIKLDCTYLSNSCLFTLLDLGSKNIEIVTTVTEKLQQCNFLYENQDFLPECHQIMKNAVELLHMNDIDN